MLTLEQKTFKKKKDFSVSVLHFWIFRSSCPKMFFKKGVLRNFAKSTGKHLCQNLFFNKVAGPRSATLLKKRLWHRCFPVNLAKFVRTPFLKNTFPYRTAPEAASGYFLSWVFVFLESQPSVLIFGPRPLTRRSSAPKYCKTKCNTTI